MEIEPQKSILLVEDNADLLDVIQNYLEIEGFDVFPASHGKQAIDFLIALQGKQPELMILDLMLPIVSGWDVLRQMRLHPRLDTIPVLVMTAAAQSIPEGAAAMIRKPFNLESFSRAIHTACRSGAGFPS